MAGSREIRRKAGSQSVSVSVRESSACMWETHDCSENGE